MQQKSVFQYFREGFFLANKSLDIFLISFIVYFLSTFFLINNNILWIVFELTFLGFVLSTPLLLTKREHKQHLSLKEIFKVVAKNVKRIILPGILLLFLLGILLLIFFGVMGIFLPTGEQRVDFLQWLINALIPISFIYILLLSFFQFTAFFFSLENNGLFLSMKRSVATSFKNIKFIALIILFGIILRTILAFIPVENIWGQSVRILFSSYVSFVITASSLFYYQNVIKKNLKH